MGIRNLNGSDSANLVQTGTRACKLIEDLYGTGHTRSAQVRKLLDDPRFSDAWRYNNDHVRSLLDILQAVEHDIENGRLSEIRHLVRAEVFSDFLGMAEYLMGEGYKDAAAVLAGGVLENALRSRATRLGIPIVNAKGRPLTLAPLNNALKEADEYNALVQKQIDSFAAIRNSAAHGRYGEYSKETVADMIRFVTRFANE